MYAPALSVRSAGLDRCAEGPAAGWISPGLTAADPANRGPLTLDLSLVLFIVTDAIIGTGVAVTIVAAESPAFTVVADIVEPMLNLGLSQRRRRHQVYQSPLGRHTLCR